MTVESQIAYQDLSAFPDLFASYCTNYPSLAEFYAGNPFDDASLIESVDRTLRVGRDRSTLVQVLAQQNMEWGAEQLVLDRIDQLVSPDASVVVTGQQLGLFGGPLYTQYKTITTIQLAAKLQRETNSPVVPVFWLAGEDHDFEEIAGARVSPDSEVRLKRRNGDAGPVGRIILQDEVSHLIEEITRLYGSGDSASEIIDVLKDTFTVGASLSDAFARYMTWMFQGTGLVIMSGDDSRLKKLAAPLFEKAVVSFESLNKGIESTTEKLADRFHAQLTPRSTNLFHLNAGRVAIDQVAEGFEAGSLSWSNDELVTEIRSTPHTFSPNVVMRPLYQDTILPTVAYVAGPGETSYFGQLRSAYEWAGVPMPIIYPRASATIVEYNIARLLEKESITVDQVDTDIERMFTALVKRSIGSSIEDIIEPSMTTLAAEVKSLAEKVAQLDPTLKKSTLAIGSMLEKEIGKLRGKLVRMEKQRQEVTRSRLTKIVENIYPGGVLQERAVTASYFVSRYGKGFIGDLLSSLPVKTDKHVVVTV